MLRKIFCIGVLAVCLKVHAAVDATYVAALDGGAGTSHLPKSLRAGAVEFYEAVEDSIKRTSGSLEVVGGAYQVFVHKFSTPTWNGLEKLWHAYVDYCIRTDGINTAINTPAILPTRPDGRAYPLEDVFLAGVGAPNVLPHHRGFYEELGGTFETLADKRNPFGLFFLGVIHFNGVGVEINPNRGINYILGAAERGYKRAVTFLIDNYGDVGAFREMLSIASLNLTRQLLDNAQEKIEEFIESRDRAEVISSSDFEKYEKSLLYQKGRVDTLKDFHENLTKHLRKTLLSMRHVPYGMRDFLGNLFVDTLTVGVPAALVPLYLESQGALNSTFFGGSQFGYKLSGYTAGISFAMGVVKNGARKLRTTFANTCCSCRFICGRTIPSSVEDDAIESEARIASLYLTLRGRDRINLGIGALRADNLAGRVSKLLQRHIDGTDTPMSKVIQDHVDELFP